MDFGTVFIALIGFSIALLMIPQFLDANIERNIELLKDDVLTNASLDQLPEAARGQLQTQWDSLIVNQRPERIKRIRQQKYVPFVSGLVVVEMILFAMSAYKIARGQRMPGFIEDTVVGLAVVLVLLTVYTAQRVYRNNRNFTRYLKTYDDYMKQYKTLS
ncbi:MAG: hypothetical protein ACPGOV_09090 [Magnetovibrionaceae bacterium]